jgi:hypothetical protein
MIGLFFSKRAIKTQKVGLPTAKALVPSIGSITQV